VQEPKVILVTGASSGIGRACARLLGAGGMRVYGAARTEPRDVSAGGEPFTYLPMDVRDDRSVGDCVTRVLREAGRIDVLLNCAGIVVGGPAEEMLADEIRDQLETNLVGIVRTCAAVLPGMRERRSGRIINVGSLAGLMGVPFQSIYSASKYAIEGYSEALQVEVRGFGITVVLVDPGDIRTEITQHRKQSGGTTAQSPYRGNMESALRAQAKSETHGWAPERVARLVQRIVRARSPRFRYMPGPFIERITPAVRRLLPDRLFLRALGIFYEMK